MARDRLHVPARHARPRKRGRSGLFSGGSPLRAAAVAIACLIGALGSGGNAVWAQGPTTRTGAESKGALFQAIDRCIALQGRTGDIVGDIFFNTATGDVRYRCAGDPVGVTYGLTEGPPPPVTNISARKPAPAAQARPGDDGPSFSTIAHGGRKSTVTGKQIRKAGLVRSPAPATPPAAPADPTPPSFLKKPVDTRSARPFSPPAQS